MPIITIRGQMGSGAPEVGRRVADKLGIDYVDREVIAEVAAKLQRQEQEVMAKEMPPTSVLGRIAEALEHSYAFGDGMAGAYLSMTEIPLEDARYLQALESVVKELARGRSLVIRGRGSQFILKNHPEAFHALVVASLDVRVKRTMEDLKLDYEAAKLEVTQFDSRLREFIKRYFKAELEDSVNYDLVVNTERLSFEAAASIIVDALSCKARTLRGQN